MEVELAADMAAHLAVLTHPSDDILKSEQSFSDSDNPGSSEQSLDFSLQLPPGTTSSSSLSSECVSLPCNISNGSQSSLVLPLPLLTFSLYVW
jgi:hypothetical protein